MTKAETVELMNGYKLPVDKFKLVFDIDRLETVNEKHVRFFGVNDSETIDKINTLKMLFQPVELQALYLNNWRA